MDSFKIGICESEDFSQKAINKLSAIGEIFFFDGSDLKKFIVDKDIIFIRLKYKIDNNLILDNAKVQYICSPTTGLNHIEVDSEKIEIVSLKGEYEFLDEIRATPEHVFGLCIALIRNYAHAFLNSSNREFNRDKYKGMELYKNKIGIIGLGRIGKILANYFKAFNAEVFYYDVNDEKSIDNCTKCNSIEQLISKTNIIILEANYTENNLKMINSDLLKLMKGKFFINAARGELVEEDELIRLIDDNWFSGVALDVLNNEICNRDNLYKLLEMCERRNLIITPHIGGATYSSMQRTEEYIVEKLLKKIEKRKNIKNAM